MSQLDLQQIFVSYYIQQNILRKRYIQLEKINKIDFLEGLLKI
jgi:hypothetical protein